MSNKPHLRATDKRRGLVEITVSDDGKVWLELFPPGKDPVQLPMLPADARGLAQGLLEGAEEAERGADT
jgi:hypothetical protein